MKDLSIANKISFCKPDRMLFYQSCVEKNITLKNCPHMRMYT